MEDDYEFEVIRLKKLLDDNILQVEKENMVYLQSSKTYENLTSSVRSIKMSSSVKTTSPVKQSGSNGTSDDTHSRIHFLNDLQSSLLPNYNRRKIFVADKRNRYIPCAVPLSPPVRLKREECQENMYSASRQSHTSENTLPKYTSLPVHTCNKFSEKNVTVIEKSQEVPLHTSNRSFEKTFPVIEKEVPAHASKKCFGKKVSVAELDALVHTRNKPSERNVTVIEKNFFATKYDGKENAALIDERKPEVKDSSQNTSFVYRERSFPIFSSQKSNCMSDENKFNSKEQVTSLKTAEGLSEDKDRQSGLHLQISLDSCSTGDVINTMLRKVPELVDKFRASADNINTCSCSCTQQREEIEQHSHADSRCHNSNSVSNKMPEEQNQTASAYAQTVFESFNIPKIGIIEKQKQTVSPGIQIASESFTNVPKFIKISSDQSEIASSSTQTDANKEELPRQDKLELHNLVKDIVMETLQNMQTLQPAFNFKMLPLSHKVDSGIQSEVESDIPDFNRQFNPSRGILDQGSHTSIRDNFILSRGVQVDLHSVQLIQEKHVHDKSCNTESSENVPEMFGVNNLPYCDNVSETGNLTSEKNASSLQVPSKVEVMLNKIYDHICQDEVQKNFTDKSSNNPLTREVAVQLRPLDTSTKAIMTSEVKKVDSSTQYDIQLNTDPVQRSKVDVSVQAIKEACDHLQVDACTQFEQKDALDSFVQAELSNMEQCVTNTSVSSTPVSDSMFMDDLLSEGEVPLPWNLRLLSLSGGMLNNTDSTDNSIKDKDYSLSEGEIPPNVIQYLNMCHCSHSDEYDSVHDIQYPTKLAADAKTSSIDTSRLNTVNPKSLRLQIPNSSESENSNTSLSLGEISPGYRVSFSDLPTKRDACSTENFQYDHLPSTSYAQSGHSPNSSFSGNEHHRNNGQVEMQNASRIVLQTVDEEVHSIYD